MKEIPQKTLNLNVEDKNLLLEYFLIEENLNSSSDIKMYGVKINMTETFSNGTTVHDTKSVHGMFSNRVQIDEFIDKLIAGTVTPLTLECIAKDYIVDLLYVK